LVVKQQITNDKKIYAITEHRKQQRWLLRGHLTEGTGCPYKTRSHDHILTYFNCFDPSLLIVAIIVVM